MSRVVVVGALLLAVPAAACTSDSEPENTSTTAEIAGSWLLDEAVAAPGSTLVESWEDAADHRITLTIEEDGTGSFTDGCNRHEASFELDGATLTVEAEPLEERTLCDFDYPGPPPIVPYLTAEPLEVQVDAGGAGDPGTLTLRDAGIATTWS